MEHRMETTRWYVFPTDGGHTNEIIAKALPSGSETVEKECTDNEPRMLWEISLEFLHQLRMAETEYGLHFSVYMALNGNRPQLFPLEWTRNANNTRLVVVAHPLRGIGALDMTNNIALARSVCQKIMRSTKNTYAWFPFDVIEILNSEDPKERQRGLYICLSVIKRFDELWLYGKHISQGMRTQVILALIQGIPVRAQTIGTKRDLAIIKGSTNSGFFARKKQKLRKA